MRTHFSREEQSYFRKRIEEIKIVKIREIRDQYTKPYLSPEEKMQLILSGAVVFVKPSFQEISERPYKSYVSCYDFTEYETPVCTDELQAKRIKDVEIEARELMDFLMINIENYRPTFFRKLEEFDRRVF